MSKSNFEVLNDNREKTLAFAKGVDGTPPVKIDIEARKKEAQQLFIDGDLSGAIKKLDQIKDNRLGIVWHESQDLGNGTSSLVRDARKVTTDETLLKIDAPEKYAMQLLNQTRGASDLIDKSNLSPEAKELAKKKLMHIATDAMANIDNLGSKTVKNYNTQMLHVLESSGIAEPEKKLKFASEIANFKDDHQHIVTLTTASDRNSKPHTVYEAEIMLNGLTDKQINQYQDIARSTPGKPCGVEWFDKMDKYKQDLLRPVALDISLGNKVIPTQLLSDVVGVRNAYQKVTAISSATSPEPKILSQTLHSGTPTTKVKTVGKEARQEITNENLKQLKSFLPPEERMNLNILTSKTPFNARGENFVSDQLKKGKKEVEGVSVSASPINRWRLIGGGGRDTKQFEQNLANVGKGLEKEVGLKHVSKYLQKGGSRFGNFVEAISFGAYETTQTKAQKELKVLNKLKPDLVLSLVVATSARSLVDSSTLMANSENVNLELTAKMAIVKNSVKSPDGALHAVVGKKIAKEYPNDVNFCKSGKDRTGYAQANETREVVSAYLDVDPKSQLGKKNFLGQLAGGHTQEMAGVQGGTIGCHSIKTNPEFGLNKSDRFASGIIDQQSSHFNSSIKTVKKPEKIIQAFEQAFEQSQTKGVAKSGKDKDVITRPRSHSVPPFVKEEAAKISGVMHDSSTRPRSASAPPPVKKSPPSQSM